MRYCLISILAFFLLGCDRTSQRQNADASARVKPEAWTKTVERCYKGVTYVIFVEGSGNSVGSVMLDTDGKIVPCN